MKDFFGENKVLPVCTFGTLSAKTAIQVAGKGLGYSNDDMEYLSSMIKVERGEVFSLHDMIEGDEEKERKPVKEFINELKRFPNLKETALGIEGLIVQRGQHASGVLITNSPFTDINCAMRTPRGELVSQFDLGDSEAMGGLKYDFLTTKCQDLLRATK